MVAGLRAERAAQHRDRLREAVFFHDPAAPDGLEQFSLVHDAVAMLEQVTQHVERLRRQHHRRAIGTEQQARLQVEAVPGEGETAA